MPLPDVCPLDDESSCKYGKCHLYHVDWRTGEENCSIGYRITSKTRSTHQPPQDNYAEDTRKMLGRDPTPQDSIRTERVRPEPAKKSQEVESVKKPEKVEYVPPAEDSLREEVVSVDKDTTVIQSYNEDEAQEDSSRSRHKKIDDAMKLDLPENYEEDFWN